MKVQEVDVSSKDNNTEQQKNRTDNNKCNHKGLKVNKLGLEDFAFTRLDL